MIGSRNKEVYKEGLFDILEDEKFLKKKYMGEPKVKLSNII